MISQWIWWVSPDVHTLFWEKTKNWTKAPRSNLIEHIMFCGRIIDFLISPLNVSLLFHSHSFSGPVPGCSHRSDGRVSSGAVAARGDWQQRSAEADDPYGAGVFHRRWWIHGGPVGKLRTIRCLERTMAVEQQTMNIFDGYMM